MGHNINNEIQEAEDESDSADATTIKFERTISVSIDVADAEVLDEEQFRRLERIFEDAFDFNSFMSNFLENFPRMEELLENEISQLNLDEVSEVVEVPTQEAIDGLPQIRVTRRHWHKNHETKLYERPKWVICISEISLNTLALFMPWGHLFHQDCLITWFDQSNKWPTCRLPLPCQRR